MVAVAPVAVLVGRGAVVEVVLMLRATVIQHLLYPVSPIPLIKEYTLNHNIKTPYNSVYSLFKGYWALWGLL